MTERLYYHDSYLWDFEASIVWRSEDGLRVQLDRTAFYPTSGGQPHDTGAMNGCRVVEVADEEDRILHTLAEPLDGSLQLVNCRIDAERRLDHMRQHTGQHLLSAVMDEEFGLKTVSFHMGGDYATVDVEPQPGSATILEQIEKRVNARLLENRVISIGFEDAASAAGLRKSPDREGIIRIVTIEGLDRSACGGTHVLRTGEVGLVVLGKTEKIRKAFRIEFYCGPRAISFLRGRIAAADSQLAQTKSKLADADKQKRKLADELAKVAGQRKYAEMAADTSGRVVWEESFEVFDEDLLPTMNAFLEGAGSVALLTSSSDGRILFGANPGLGLDCGKRFKDAMNTLGGRGGGSPKSAQGSIPDMSKLSLLRDLLIL